MQLKYLLPSFSYYAPAIFNVGAYSITAVGTYIYPVRPVRPVSNTIGFCEISFEKIGVLD